MQLEIKRAYTDLATLGDLYLNGKLFCKTIERPWMDNKRVLSCIPEGNYLISHYISPTQGECYLIHNVPERDGILIHAANFVRELQGCIAVGLEHTVIQERIAVSSSRTALDRLIEALGKENHTLTIGVKTL